MAPFGFGATILSHRFVVDSAARARSGTRDVAGSVLITLGLAGLIGGLTASPERGFTDPLVLAAIGGGVALIIAFVVAERRSTSPVLPLDIFASRQFTGANITTLFVYAALTALFLLLMLELQNVLGYSALEAGASLLPINALMLVISPIVGRLAERIGARLPMVCGALVAWVPVSGEAKAKQSRT